MKVTQQQKDQARELAIAYDCDLIYMNDLGEFFTSENLAMNSVKSDKSRLARFDTRVPYSDEIKQEAMALLADKRKSMALGNAGESQPSEAEITTVEIPSDSKPEPARPVVNILDGFADEEDEEGDGDDSSEDETATKEIAATQEIAGTEVTVDTEVSAAPEAKPVAAVEPVAEEKPAVPAKAPAKRATRAKKA